MNHNKKGVAIVTGGASGIGEALCQELGTRGMTVIIADINEASARQTADKLKASGIHADSFGVDVGDPKQMQDMVDAVVKRYKRIDYLFNNAGIALIAQFDDMTIDTWKKMVHVNLWGAINGTHAAYPVMLKQGFGHVINVASGAGIIPAPFMTAYAATKHAVVGMSVALSTEAAGSGVNVSIVCPGFVRTPLTNSFPTINFDQAKLQKMISSRKAHTPDAAAKIIMRGVERKKLFILFPVRQKVMWGLYRHFPNFFINVILRKAATIYRKFHV